MANRHGRPEPAGKLPTIGVAVAVAALLFSFFAQPLAVLLALAAIIIAVVVLVRSRKSGLGKRAALGSIAVGVLALVLAGAMGPESAPAPVAAPPAAVVDPNALPATVTVASAQSPDNLLTTGGRRLHVTMMQGRPAPDACQARSDIETTAGLVVGQQVQIAAPDPLRVDVATAVPPGFQSVVLTLPDGRDYAQAWSTAATQSSSTTCTTTTTPTTTTEPAPTTTTEDSAPVDEQDVDVDRPYVPRAPSGGSGGSGHPCLPGERDGDGDGRCGE